jgi:hypothetical protein
LHGCAPEREERDQAGPDTALAIRYGIAVATDGNTLELVEKARNRFGERGLIVL